MSSPFRPLRLAPAPSVLEKRLLELLGGAGEGTLRPLLLDGHVAGSLELAGQVEPGARTRLRQAAELVGGDRPLSVGLLEEWHRLALDTGSGLRATELPREGGPPTAPAEFVRSRLDSLEEWLGGESGKQLRPAQAGALALARIVEIAPFERGNGRVARLAAAHAMVRAGGRVPLLRGEDAAALQASLQAAFQFHTEPLCELLERGAERALQAMIEALQRP